MRAIDSMRLLPLCLALLAAPAAAEIYSYVDAQGNRVFTDRPRDDTAELRLNPTNRMAAPPPPPAVEKPALRAKKPAYQWLRILEPEPDATLHETEGSLTVTVASEPGLYPGHRYRLLLDDQATGAGGAQPVFALNGLERGTHRLVVEILDAKDRPQIRSAEQAVHVHRISLLQRRLTNPCRLADYGVRPECPLADKPD